MNNEFIDDIDLAVNLKPDEFRSYIHKMEWKDLNGKFSIGTTEGDDPDLESEYTKVDFFLKPAHKIEYTDGNIHLFGAFPEDIN